MISFGIFFETVLAALICYTPVNVFILCMPVNWLHFGIPGFPFFLLILVTEEVRKWILRKPF